MTRISPASLPQIVRSAGGALSVDEAARRLFRTSGNGARAARRVLLALAAEEHGVEVDEERLVRLVGPQSMDTLLRDAHFVVLDVETTGSTMRSDRVTEVGALRVVGNQRREAFETLVNPGRPLAPAVVRLTGIDDSLLAEAPRFERVAGPLLDFLGNAVLVAHNAAFDTRFLEAELAHAGAPPLSNPVLCTVRLARRMLPALRSWNLDVLAAHFGFRFQARHRAFGDAEVTARILVELIGIAAERSAETLGDLLDLSRRRRPRTAAPKRTRG